MKTLHMMVLSGLLLTSVQPKVKAFDDNNIMATIGVGAAALASLIGGAYLVNWLITPTDEQLIANVKNDLLDYTYTLKSLITDLSSHSYTDYASVAYNLQRSIDAAGGADISNISKHINAVIDAFDKTQHELSSRIAKLSKDQDISARHKIGQMDALKTELHMTQPALLYAQRFIKDHAAYFELGRVLDKTYNKFQYEYSIAYNNSPISMELIKISPLLARNYKYIWHAYLDDMKSIHAQIKSAGADIRREWIPAYGNIYPVYERLNIYFAALIAQVQTSDLFAQEKYFKAHQELLERQLELEREIKRIEQAKLEAIRQQNYYLQEQNELKERELRLQYERLLAQLHDANPNITIHFRN